VAVYLILFAYTDAYQHINLLLAASYCSKCQPKRISYRLGLFCIPIYIWLLLLLQEIQNISISKLKIGSIFVGKLGKANLSRRTCYIWGSLLLSEQIMWTLLKKENLLYVADLLLDKPYSANSGASFMRRKCYSQNWTRNFKYSYSSIVNLFVIFNQFQF
jgi:hypothetical protein